MDKTDLRRIQLAYPRIWHACHRHPSAAAREGGLTERQGMLLAHLASGPDASPTSLASHLGIAQSTLSEGIDQLVARGLVRRQRLEEDRRRVQVEITDDGWRVVDSGSALDPKRLAAALEHLDGADRRRAVQGLELLAEACAALSRGEPR